MSGHAERAHALLSASGSHRWMHCTPSAKLESQFPDTTSEAAREGTIAHELAEGKLRNKFYPKLYSSHKLSALRRKLRQNDLWNEEMEGFTDDYVDEIYRMSIGYADTPILKIESLLDLSPWIPEGFGTADAVLITPYTIHVCDLKYGKGVPVDPDRNPQMMLYALGAWFRYGTILDIKTVRMTILQPRLGAFNTWECSIEELIAFGEEVKEKASLAINGEGDFEPSTESCRFCRAKAVCRARAEYNSRLKDVAGKDPALLTLEEIGEYLKIGDDVAKWLKDLQEYALAECLNGANVPGWKAVNGRSSRKWTDQDGAFEAIVKAGYPEDLLWERKPLTLAAVEKVVGKSQFADIAGKFYEVKAGAPALVVETDKRPAISNKTTVEEAFKGL